MKKAFIVGALACVMACEASSSTTPVAPTMPLEPDVCAGDAPWLLAILGELPHKSDAIHLDHARNDPFLWPAIERGQGRDIDGQSAWLRNVAWTSQEIYEYRPQANGEKQKVAVGRGVTGKDPRTLGDFGKEPAFGAPAPLASGVVEYPAARRNGQHLFVFPDATWVFVEAWMASRFRTVFAGTSVSPPRPASPPDTYVEYCFPHDGRSEVDASKMNGLDMKADHWAMRFKAGHATAQGLEAELAYTFPSPEIAQREEAEQRLRCTRSPCQVLSGRVDGRVVRYLVR